MIFITSPAKRFDFSSEWKSNTSQARFIKESEKIASILKSYSVQKLSQKLHISPKLAELNFSRFKSWNIDDIKKQKPAILAYQGDVYQSLNAASLNQTDMSYLQDNLRIITGMYGILKPNDLIQAYRLEMKIKLNEKNIDNLYDFWSEKITGDLNKQIKENHHQYIINLSSNEYSKAINKKKIAVPFVNIKFTQLRNGELKSIGLLNKRARGLMIRHLAQIKAKNIKDITSFDLDGYKIESQSSNELVFLKK